MDSIGHVPRGIRGLVARAFAFCVRSHINRDLDHCVVGYCISYVQLAMCSNEQMGVTAFDLT